MRYSSRKEMGRIQWSCTNLELDENLMLFKKSEALVNSPNRKMAIPSKSDPRHASQNAVDEDASKLEFGPEFNDVSCLLHSDTIQQNIQE